MSFNAVWSIQNADESGEQMTVTTPEEVDALLTRLAESGAGAAVIEHQERALIPDVEGLLGAPGEVKIPDHDVAAAVSSGFGYLTYADPDQDYSTLVGEDGSPVYASEYVDYPAGSGVRVGVLAEALKEFLATGRRPSCVEWQEA
ncbi:Imm1 family immunity protein [Umezawaea sp. Da 62-37]|uniref:Imm1 family immunity protein n=1 Tax=Umezawaea sp. Da 62-37 TaxID=3075927 RepID=UPI0028F6EEA5|nr:Imm1 family immunity protein [Umezawaea sp. Da 62-37]WNV90622.1 Imm1 family immunity protein [Umezawaea sp. Da 62-37]